MITNRKNDPIADEVNNVETNSFLLRENKKTNDFLRKTTMMHDLLADCM